MEEMGIYIITSMQPDSGNADFWTLLYKYAVELFYHRLLKFFNNTIKTDKIPKKWKSIAVPVFKEGDKIKNYR